MNSSYLTALPAEVRGAAAVPEPVPAPQRFNGTVVDHHDGDTFFADVNFEIYGLISHRMGIRLVGAAARELSDPGGKEARDALMARPGMTLGSPVVLTVVRYDKYGGRMDAVVSYRGADGKSHDLAADLIADQWAAPWDGKGKQPQPPWPRTV
jgi:hypothetical protein